MFHILVVDDDKNTRKLIEAVLRRENFTVSTSENGKDALEKLDGEHSDTDGVRETTPDGQAQRLFGRN